MQIVTTIGLDVARSVFQLHGIDAAGSVVIRRQLKRRYVLPFFEKLPQCLIGMEACATSHHWSRELQALGSRIRICCGMLAGSRLPTRATAPEPCRPIAAAKPSSTPSGTPNWRRRGSRTSGETDLI